MAYRPYFRYTVKQLQEEFEKQKRNPGRLRVLQYELRKRSVPSARALSQEVDAALIGAHGPCTSPAVSSVDAGQPHLKPSASTPPTALDRVVVECGYCHASNIVAVAEGTQHLSCCQCARPYIAKFAHGMLRTTFPPIEVRPKSRVTIALWVLVGLLAVAMLVALMTK